MQILVRELFNAGFGIFAAVPEGSSTFQPNPNSIVQSEFGTTHLDYFRFAGRLVGKAMFDGQTIDAHFTRSMYKHMLSQPLTYEVGLNVSKNRSPRPIFEFITFDPRLPTRISTTHSTCNVQLAFVCPKGITIDLIRQLELIGNLCALGV